MYSQSEIGWDNFLLGRWSPAWRLLQTDHYKALGSLKSGRRWAAAVIHQLMMTAWDLWQYRNNRLHQNDGPRALAEHASLNLRIEEQVHLGTAGMLPSSRHLLQHNPIYKLRSMTIPNKSFWLHSVRIGRKDFADTLAGTPPRLRREAALMQAWLTPVNPP